MNNEYNGINNIGQNKWGIIFHIGSLPVTLYGILVISGFIISVIICSIKLKKFYKISYDPSFYFAILAFPVGILGASIWSAIIGNSQNFYDGFTGKGGLAIQGGVVAGIIAGLFWFPLILKKSKYWQNVPFGKRGEYEKLARVSSWVYFDNIIPAIILGQAIGRWGNFFNYEVFGQQVGGMNYQEAINQIKIGDYSKIPFYWLYSTMPGVWHNMWISASHVVNTGTFVNPSSEWMTAAHFYQPLFLYESFFNIIFFVILSYVLNFIPGFKVGVIGGTTLMYTGLFRVFTEKQGLVLLDSTNHIYFQLFY